MPMSYAYVLIGETFQHRNTLREGRWFRWDADTKKWVAPINPNSLKDDTSLRAFVKSLSGVSMIEERAEKFKVLR